MKIKIFFLISIFLITMFSCEKKLICSDSDKNRTMKIINHFLVSLKENDFNIIKPFLYRDEYISFVFNDIYSNIKNIDFTNYKIINEIYFYYPIPTDIPKYVYEKWIKKMDGNKEYELKFMFVRKNKDEELTLMSVDLLIDGKDYSVNK